jgi:hypothetical protein
MWLSEKSGLAGAERGAEADMGRVTIGGRSAAVDTDGEHRAPVLLAPGGVCWLPSVGQEGVLLSCGDGTEVLIGCAQSGYPEGMQPGEVYIRSGSCSIYLRGTGRIDINGQVNITGNLSVNGKSY